MVPFVDIVGQEFNRLLVLKFMGLGSHNQRIWLCLCNCGNGVVVSSTSLNSGSTQSCGCLQRERTGNSRRSHGMSKTKFYSNWCQMVARCSKPKASHYEYYGGRGITVCDRWLKFENYMADTYQSYLEHVKEFGESNTTSERIDSDGNYEPSNHKWATPTEQARTKRTSSKSVDYEQHNYWHHKLQATLSHGLTQRIVKSKIFKHYIGMTTQEFRSYIESRWESWMNWDNYGYGVGRWSLDHIVSVNKFDLSKEEDRLICWNYKNLRPYDAVKNNKEHSRELVTI